MGALPIVSNFGSFIFPLNQHATNINKLTGNLFAKPKIARKQMDDKYKHTHIHSSRRPRAFSFWRNYSFGDKVSLFPLALAWSLVKVNFSLTNSLVVYVRKVISEADVQQ